MTPSHRPIVVPAPAKLNLGLVVGARRADGYHDIATLMVPIDWADRLEISAIPGPRDVLELTEEKETTEGNEGTERTGFGTAGPKSPVFNPQSPIRNPLSAIPYPQSPIRTPSDASNLVMKALLALRRHLADRGAQARLPGALLVRLDKRIPAASGLGGGSSDAATLLTACNEHYGLELSPSALAALALSVGSDVPFFLDPRPALGFGRGEELVGVSLDTPTRFVVLVGPFGCESGRVYGALEPERQTRRAPASWQRARDQGGATLRFEHPWLENDLEAPARRVEPRLNELFAAIEALGLPKPAMSGSGSALFWPVEDDGAERRLLGALQALPHRALRAVRLLREPGGE